MNKAGTCWATDLEKREKSQPIQESALSCVTNSEADIFLRGPLERTTSY